MVAGEVCEHGELKPDGLHPFLGQRMGGHLHDKVLIAALRSPRHFGVEDLRNRRGIASTCLLYTSIDNLVGKYAAGIVMDVKTGGILAMAVEQDFDLNAPFTITDEKTLEELSKLEGDEYANARAEALETLWKNVLVTDQYEPGSTFKTITSSIAVEEKKVSDSSTFYCNGYRNIAGTIIHCANRSGHGSEDFQRALCNSCNPAFMDIGALIGGDTFYDYVTGFGLRERTGIDLPGEGVGIFHAKDAIGPVQLATISFGQTFKVTPVSYTHLPFLTARATTRWSVSILPASSRLRPSFCRA